MTKTLYVGYYQPGMDEYIVAVTFDRQEAFEKTEDSRLALSPRARQVSRHFVIGCEVEVDPRETPQEVFDRLPFFPPEDLVDDAFFQEIHIPSGSY